MHRTAIWLLIVGTLAAACGAGGNDRGGTAPPAASGSGAAAARGGSGEAADVNACDLVTKAELSTALGSPVGDGEESGLRGCRWKAESGVAATLAVYAGRMFTPKTCEAQKVLVSGREEAVAGIGDSALWGSSGDLVVCTASAVLRVDIAQSRNDPQKDREALLAIARAALGRL